MTWEPTSVTSEDWGRLQVVIGNRDLTFYRDVITVVESWSSAEPFDDKNCVLRFPGITSYETIDDLPFNEFDNVEIWRVDENNVKQGDPLFEGFIGSLDDELQESDNGLTVECVGALYQADFFLKPPNFGFAPEDSGLQIATEMNLRSKYYGLRLKQMNWLTYTSVPTRAQGSWNPLLSGWAQELLSNAYSPAFMFDGEQANAIATSEDGYWVMGDHGTFATFGERMPNYGSSTWFNAIFIHLFNDPGLWVTDMWYDRDRKEAYYISRGGYVGFRVKDKTDEPANWPWYGDWRNTPQLYWEAIHGTDNMLGYRAMNVYGTVGVAGNAVHYGNGPSLGTASFSGGVPPIPDIYIDMCRTPSGNGYWLLTWGGKIYEFGDATAFADQTPIDNVFIGLDCTPDGTGMYLLDAAGRVTALGTATHHGQPGPINTASVAYRDISVSATGDGYALVRTDGDVDTYGDQAYEGTAQFSDDPSAGGNVSQYTMLKLPGRRPVVRTKDTWTVDWTVTVGTPGVSHSLKRDRTQMSNVFYGEGIDGNNCKWRNSKYPNFFPGDDNPPLWPGYYISLFANNQSPGVTEWQKRMQALGFSIQVDGIYDAYDDSLCRFLQGLAGITVDGIIGPQTWTATFQPGSAGGDLKSAYIAPLVTDRRVEPFLYNANGSIIGDNPNFDKSIMRIETYSNYGEKSSKREATISARNELKRNDDPGYAGTITLKIDPEEGSRFEMKAGQNILYKGYRGQDVLFHIAGVEVDIDNLTTTLTVDSKARDLQTVMAMIQRDRTIGDWPLQPTRPQNTKSKQIDDSVVFDCESKAGFIPYFITPGNLWNVIRIPVGEVGTVVKTEFATIFPAARYSVAMFDRRITANTLQGLGSPETADYWKNFPEDLGLMISWGGEGQMCGYYPGAESDADTLTGQFVDASSWNFWSSEPPWIWIAIWADRNTVINGRLYPGPEAGFNFASVDAIANPMEINPSTRQTIADFGGD